jgi:hypothetical protein
VGVDSVGGHPVLLLGKETEQGVHTVEGTCKDAAAGVAAQAVHNLQRRTDEAAFGTAVTQLAAFGTEGKLVAAWGTVMLLAAFGTAIVLLGEERASAWKVVLEERASAWEEVLEDHSQGQVIEVLEYHSQDRLEEASFLAF